MEDYADFGCATTWRYSDTSCHPSATDTPPRIHTRRRYRPINGNRIVTARQPCPRARPIPIFRSLDQAAFHGIGMNVLDDLLNAAWLGNILIPPPTGLPKTIPSAIRATSRQLR